MNYQLATILCNFAMLLQLDSFILLNAEPAPTIITPSNITVNNNCSKEISNLTEGNSLYSHSKIFGTNATLNDVETFKYYCTNELIVSTIITEMVSIIYL